MKIINILKKIWHVWKTVGMFIAKIVMTIFSSVLYIIIITPFGIIIRLFTDYLNIRSKDNTMWNDKMQKDRTLKDMRKQY